MTFPVDIPLGPWRLHPHLVFETLAYFVGFRLYLWQRRRRGDVIPGRTRWSVVAAAILGGAIGSRVLFLFEDPAETARHLHDVAFLLSGKTVVGGLVGGWIGVELTKWALGIVTATGDLFALPLAVGIAIGRVGCFLSGLEDRTYGLATSLPWGVDFGDGVSRHPTQLYEMFCSIALAVVIMRAAKRPHVTGDLFKLFMVGYLGCRLLIDAIKPGVPLAGLTAIQWVCLAAIVWYAPHVRRWVAVGASHE
jgi:prolipoprotein diacylglyceryltransferase